MIRRLIIPLCLVLLGTMPAIALGEWKVKQFELFDKDKGQPEGAFKWMNEVGVKLKDANFVQPLILPLQNNHFRVNVSYFTGWKKNFKGYYDDSKCSSGETLPTLNLNRTFAGTKFMTFVFSHEVTHAIQVNSPFMEGCTNIDRVEYPLWVVEGIANAVGYEMAEQRWSDFRVTQTVRPQYALGHRDYSRPLDLRDHSGVYKLSDHEKWDEKDKDRSLPGKMVEERDEDSRQAAYMTGSFFSHLVDQYGLEAIAGILGHTLAPQSNDTLTLQWLEGALGAAVGPKLPKNKKFYLYHIYPQAVSEIASFVFSRYKSYYFGEDKNQRKLSGEEARRTWLNEVYGGHGWSGTLDEEGVWHEQGGTPCREFSLTRLGATQEIAITNMAEIASLCLQVDWREMPTGARMFVEAETRTPVAETLADSLHLGSVYINTGGNETNCYEMAKSSPEKCLIKTFVKRRADENKYVKHWEIGVTVGEGQNGPDGEYYFNMSNVAPLPWQTLKIGPGQLKVRVGFCMATSGSGRLFTCPRPVGPKLGGNASAFMGGDERRMRYGIDESAFGLGALGDVPGMPSMTGFEIEATSADGSVKRYTIVPSDDNPPGYTGPLNGQVGTDSEGMDTLVLSTFCNQDRLVLIGQVLRSDDTELKLSISTDLCEIDPILQNCCDIVDHLEVEITMPFGWRYFHRSAPHDVVTPGMEDYITLFTDAVDSRMDSIFGGGSSDGSGGSPDTDGGNGGASIDMDGGIFGQQSSDCDCSCEALEERIAQCEAADRDDIAAAMECARCISGCTEALIACRKDDTLVEGADQSATSVETPVTASVEPPAQDVLRTPEAGPATCTCTCESMVYEAKLPGCQDQCGMAWVPCITAGDFPPPTAADLAELRELLHNQGWDAEGIAQYEELMRASPPALRHAILEQFRGE